MRTGYDLEKAAVEAATALEEQSREIERLRGLLIDPGDPAWEDARGVLAAELRKAEMPNHARAVADAEGAYIPSWMALNLIAHAACTALSPSDTVEKP